MLILDKASILLSTESHFFMARIPQDVGKFPLRFYPVLTWLHHISSADLSGAHSCYIDSVLPHNKDVLFSDLVTGEAIEVQ